MTKDGSDGGPGSAGTAGPAAVGSENGTEVSTALRITVTVVVLAVGAVGMTLLALLKKDPAEASVAPRSISVETITVSPEDVPVTVSGLGEVRALNVVPIAPEVAGTVVEIHPRLETGEVIPAGERLFRIDPRDYTSARDQAASQVAQLERTVERLERQYAIDQGRLRTLERNERLMEDEYKRVKVLYEEDEVGTRSAVDRAEVAFNEAGDARAQLSQTVELYPIRIQEAQSGLEGARAQLAQAEANLSRTEVACDFDARIKMVDLEAGQYVNPGVNVLTLADDRLLEISVPLDSRDARNWLLFEETSVGGQETWFGALKPVACTVAWTEDPVAHRWEGRVHRIEDFDPNTRTVRVAVRVTAEAASAGMGAGGLPLVEGMFCSVEIPGKSMENVYRLPRWAVSYEGFVYLARDNRLAIQPVDVVRSEGEETFVRGGLEPGAEVITTRLVNPLPNAPLSIESVPGTNP